MKRLQMLINDIKKNSCHSLDFLLSNDVDKTISVKGIKIRKIFAPLLRAIYTTQTKYKLVIDSREKLNGNSGRIFVVNHRQGDDMVLSARAVNQSGYFVFGNAILLLDSLSNGFGLWSYGAILLNRSDKESRKATYEKMKYVLQNKGNIIIFPEGYWNLDDNGQKDERHGADSHNSENWLIQDINIGALRLAQELGSEVVPTILHYDEFGKSRCYARRGKPFKIEKTDDVIEKKNELMVIMHTMYYELMERYSSYSVSELESNELTLKQQWEMLKKELVASCDIDSVGYKLDLTDEKRIGKAKVVNPVTTSDEAFEHLQNIEYNQNNAFLLSKRYSGR